MEDEEDGKFSPKTYGVMLAIFVALSPIYLLSIHYGVENRGFIVYCITGVFCSLFYACRNLAKRVRFIALIVSLYIVHLLIILLIPLPEKIPGAIMIAVSIVDLIVVDSIIGALESRSAL